MAAYLIIDTEVKDPAAYEQYKNGAPAIVSKHGGEYLVRGGKVDVLEGSWKPSRVVVMRFPDRKAADSFLGDPAYRPLNEIRQRAAKTDMVLVEGS